MIDKVTYEQVDGFVKEFREQLEVIKKLSEGRNVGELMDFIDSVETYCKFLENTVELNKDADKALKDIVK